MFLQMVSLQLHPQQFQLGRRHVPPTAQPSIYSAVTVAADLKPEQSRNVCSGQVVLGHEGAELVHFCRFQVS
jgi:hypothetical protein